VNTLNISYLSFSIYSFNLNFFEFFFLFLIGVISVKKKGGAAVPVPIKGKRTIAESETSTDPLETDWQLINPSPTESSYLSDQTFRKHRGSGMKNLLISNMLFLLFSFSFLLIEFVCFVEGSTLHEMRTREKECLYVAATSLLKILLEFRPEHVPSKVLLAELSYHWGLDLLYRVSILFEF